MRLRDLGEFGLIERIARAARQRGAPPRAWRVGLGDDAAVLRPPRGCEIVVSTDAVVEGVHFEWALVRPGTLGRRALAAALSDLAAMGARPLGALLALALPPEEEVSRILGLARGLVAEGERHGCPLVGGNVTRGPRTSATITVLGAVARGRALRRDGARPGDRIFVTGCLGAGALALARARRTGRPSRHVPEPRLAAGRALGRLRGIGGCIDVSDGLRADLGHLARASRVRAEIDPARVPRPRGFTRSCAALGLDPEPLLLEGGEDYELLFTVRPVGPSESALAARLGAPVREIGRVAAGRPPRPGGGWTHF